MGEEVIEIDKIKEWEIRRVEETYEHIKNVKADDSPFVVIKPSGIKYTPEILEFLKSQGIDILKITTMPDWSNYALFLYLKNKGQSVEVSMATNKAHEIIEQKEEMGVHLLLEERVSEEKLAKIKEELRKKYGGSETRQFRYDGKLYTLKLDCIHSPDSARQSIESKVTKYFLRTNLSRRLC